MSNSKPVSSTMSTSTKLSSLDGPTFKDFSLYRSVVRSLQYLVFTRPNISFVVNKVCQFMHFPMVLHWQAVKHILRYLRLTSSYVIHFSLIYAFQLQAFSEADWAGCPMIRSPQVAFVSFLALTWFLGAP